MNIDESTLMMVLGVASITASAMFFVLHASARHITGVRLWAWACLLVGFAVLLDAPRLVENWQWASLLFNIPLSVGQALFLVGTAHFVGYPTKKHTLLLLVVTVVLLTIVFTLLLPSSVLRIFTLSTFQACVNGYTAWLLWRYREPRSCRSYYVASAVVLAQAGAALAQGLLVLTSSVTVTYAAPELPFANIVTWVGAMANALIGNWILFLLVMLRLVGELKTVAAEDSLTGLLNRRGLRSHIDSVLSPASSVHSLAVLLLDIDNFKTVNDQHGHDVGDKVLAMMGEVMLALSSPHVAPCRWGGEEFCLVVDSYSDKSLIELAEYARREFHRTTRSLPDLPSGATVSVGLASMRIDGIFEFSKLVAAADAQLYMAKRGGRNRLCSAINSADNGVSELVI